MVLTLLLAIVVQAQEQMFTGTVTDGHGEPIIGASVVEKGSNTRCGDRPRR
jgi:hypothetical protein